jgi:hypothetical protein
MTTRSSSVGWRYRSILGVVAVAAALATGSGSRASAASAQSSASTLLLLTDKTGYFAGEPVAIRGSGFTPGEVVTLKVTHADGKAEAGMGHEPFVATVAPDGSVAAEWSIGSHEGAAEFVLTLQPVSGSPVTTAFRRMAFIYTDKFDYSAGQTAIISGMGFLPNETVTVLVQHSNGLNDGSGHLPYDVPADAYGRFTLPWYVHPDDSLGAIMRVTSKGKSSGLEAATTFTDPPQTTTDTKGADSLGGQRDLNQMMVDNTPAPGRIAVAWQWDDTSFGGGAGDACGHFDTDADGNANIAVCVTTSGRPPTAGTVTVYTCTDTAPTCQSGSLKPAPYATNVTVSVAMNSDPFGVPSSPTYTPAHVTGNTCGDNPGCYTADTVANLSVSLSDLGAATARLTNVCSYNSLPSFNNPQDCIVPATSGFLTIKKTTVSTGGSQLFQFASSRAAANGTTQFSTTIAGSQSEVVAANAVPFTSGAVNVTETIPSGWDLTNASCAVQRATPAATGTLGGSTVSNISIEPGLETICVFTNTKQTPGLGLTKTAAPTTYDTPGQTITYSYTLKNTGSTTLAGPFTVRDDKIGTPVDTPFACGSGPLAPNATTSCTATYVITQADINAGSVTNNATASGNSLTATATATVTSSCAAPAQVSISPAGAVAKTVGESLTVTATATGTPVLHYVWKKDGSAINGAPDSATYTIPSVSLGSAGTYTVVVSNQCGAGTASTNNALVTVNRVATALTVGAATGTYGGSTTAALTATLTAGGSGVAGKTIVFTLNGATVGTAVTNATGVATLAAPSSLAGINAGIYASGVGAAFAEDATYQAQTATNTLTVDKARVTATAGSGGATYDGTAKSPSACVVSGTYTGDLKCENNPATIGPGAGTSIINPVVSGSGLSNFEITTVAGSFKIDKATSTTVVTCPVSVTYNGTAQTPCTVAVTGAGGLNLTPTPTYSNNTNAGTATASYTYAGDANHLGSDDSKTFTIAKAPVTATAGTGTAVYDGYAKTASACMLSGAFKGDLVCANNPASIGPGAGTTTVVPVVSGSQLANFEITSINGTYNIGKRAAQVLTASSQKNFGSADPVPLTQVQLDNFVAADQITAMVSRAAGESVQTYPIVTVLVDPLGRLGNYEVTNLGGIFRIVDWKGPEARNVAVTPNPVQLNTPFVISAIIDDTLALMGNSLIQSAEYQINDGATWIPMSASQPSAFKGSNITQVTATVAGFAAGVYKVCVRGTDVHDNTGDSSCVLLAVYDPNGGFVTGGGWIDSPAGAFTADPSLLGRANFGFVSKYQKGKTGTVELSGQTEFQFQAGGLNFHSTSYEWLVVSGSRAQYKGVGRIQGDSREFGFLLTATDGQVAGGGGVDRFRIKIWEIGGAIVYDNQPGDGDEAPALTALAAGSIVIHEPAGKK